MQVGFIKQQIGYDIQLEGSYASSLFNPCFFLALCLSILHGRYVLNLKQSLSAIYFRQSNFWGLQGNPRECNSKEHKSQTPRKADR